MKSPSLEELKMLTDGLPPDLKDWVKATSMLWSNRFKDLYNQGIVEVEKQCVNQPGRDAVAVMTTAYLNCLASLMLDHNTIRAGEETDVPMSAEVLALRQQGKDLIFPESALSMCETAIHHTATVITAHLQKRLDAETIALVMQDPSGELAAKETVQ